MKKMIIAALLLLAVPATHAQGVHFGIKGGANFANVKSDGPNADNLTSFHGGVFVELNLTPSFSIQPEALYSSQGAKVDGLDDIKLDYINIPVMARFYVVPKFVSIDAGPQFGFLINDNLSDVEAGWKSKSFDLGIAGGATVDIAAGFFASARYIVGLTDASDNSATANFKNMTAQLSLGYKF